MEPRAMPLRAPLGGRTGPGRRTGPWPLLSSSWPPGRPRWRGRPGRNVVAKKDHRRRPGCSRPAGLASMYTLAHGVDQGQPRWTPPGGQPPGAAPEAPSLLPLRAGRTQAPGKGEEPPRRGSPARASSSPGWSRPRRRSIGLPRCMSLAPMPRTSAGPMASRARSARRSACASARSGCLATHVDHPQHQERPTLIWARIVNVTSAHSRVFMYITSGSRDFAGALAARSARVDEAS